MRYSASRPLDHKIEAIPVWNTAPSPIAHAIDPIASLRDCLQQLPHQQFTTALELVGELLGASGLRLYLPDADPAYLQTTYQIGPQPDRLDDGSVDPGSVGDHRLVEQRLVEQRLVEQRLVEQRLVEQHLLWQQFLAFGRHNQTGDAELSSPDTWVINHLSYEFRLRTLATAFEASQIEHIMVLPLRDKDQLLGSLSVFRRRDCPAWDLAQIALAQSLAPELAAAIAQHQPIAVIQEINQALSQRTDELAHLVADQQLLAAVVTQIRNSIELEEIFYTTVKEVYQRLQADRVVVYRFKPDWSGEFIAEAVGAQWTPLKVVQFAPGRDITPIDHCVAQSFPQAPLPDPDAYLQQNQGGSYAHQRSVKQIDDVDQQNFTDCYLNLLRQYECRAYLTAPIYQADRLWGLLAVYQNNAPRSWATNEIRLIKQISDQLSIAIQQAELLDHSRSQAAELATTLNELTQMQVQMLQSEKMSSLGQLTAGLTHEINNPVTFIHSNISHLSQYFQDLMGTIAQYQQHHPIPDPIVQAHLATIDFDFLQDDATKVLNSIANGAQRISQVVQSLNQFARLNEAGIKAIDLHQGLDSVILILQHQCQTTPTQPGIAIQTQYGDLPLVACDARLVNQVLMNIVSNAIEALQARDRERSPAEIAAAPSQIVIGTARSTQLGCPSVQITIQDNGPGIPAAIQPRVFEPFFTTKDVGQGAGLGLSLSYQIIVDQHRGSLQCRSIVGVGTTFEIQLPVDSAVADAAPLDQILLEGDRPLGREIDLSEGHSDGGFSLADKHEANGFTLSGGMFDINDRAIDD
jgi:signal transduction histidine kinase